VALVRALLFYRDLGLTPVALARPAYKFRPAVIVPNLLLNVGLAFSIVFPERFPARVLRCDIERNTKPFGSDAPVFPDEPPAALLTQRGLKNLVVRPRDPARRLIRQFDIESSLEFVRMPHEYILDGVRLSHKSDWH